MLCLNCQMPSIVSSFNDAFMSIATKATTLKQLLSKHCSSSALEEISPLLAAIEASAEEGNQLYNDFLPSIFKDFDATIHKLQSDGEYAGLILNNFKELQQSFDLIRDELEYQRRCHKACHDEVFRLRQVIMALPEKAKQSPGYYTVERLRSKALGKMKSYMDGLQAICGSMESQIAVLSAGGLPVQSALLQDLKDSQSLISNMRHDLKKDFQTLKGNIPLSLLKCSCWNRIND
jgi:hypothetical protein